MLLTVADFLSVYLLSLVQCVFSDALILQNNVTLSSYPAKPILALSFHNKSFIEAQ